MVQPQRQRINEILVYFSVLCNPQSVRSRSETPAAIRRLISLSVAVNATIAFVFSL